MQIFLKVKKKNKMAIFKCKMCGASLEVNRGDTTAKCEYCMTNQTLPAVNDERVENLFNRANHFRRSNDFDKAISADDNHTIDLKSNGTVVAVGENADGQCDVEDWTDIAMPFEY